MCSSSAIYIFMILQISSVAGQFAIIPPKNPIIGFLGQDVILPCHLKTSSIPEGTSVTLEWILAQSSEIIEVKSYYEGRKPESQDRRYEGRTEVFYNEINKGNMSLKLKKSQEFDQGKYTCMIQLGEWYDEVIVELKLTANGAEPTIALELHQDWGIGLTCSSQGWYPTPPVLWLNSKGENRTEKAESTNTEQDPGRAFHVSSSMTIQPGGDNEVSCKIINMVLQMESESRIQISDMFYPTRSPWLLPFIMVLLIDMCLLAFVAYKLRESYQEVSQLVKKKKHISKERHHVEESIGTEKQTFQSSGQQEYKAQFARISEELELRRAQSHAAAFTLDPDHKHPELIISQDHRRAQLQPALPPKTVTRSGTLMVVGKEGYASGKHYWELGVGDSLDWELGVLTQAARDKVKKEKFSGPLGDGCWALRSSREGFFTHQGGEKIEKKEVSYEKIGMFLDREHGTITFYNAEILFLISSIPTQSNERLYPFLSFVQAGEDASQSSLEVIYSPVPVPLKAPQGKENISMLSFLKKSIQGVVRR